MGLHLNPRFQQQKGFCLSICFTKCPSLWSRTWTMCAVWLTLMLDLAENFLAFTNMQYFFHQVQPGERICFSNFQIKYLFKKADGQTCLHLACARGEENIIRTLYLARFCICSYVFNTHFYVYLYWRTPSRLCTLPGFVFIVMYWIQISKCI